MHPNTMPETPAAPAEPPNGLKPKPDGRIATLERRINELGERVKIFEWLWVERAEKERQAAINQLRMIAMQRALQTPQMQQQIDAEVAAQMPLLGFGDAPPPTPAQ